MIVNELLKLLRTTGAETEILFDCVLGIVPRHYHVTEVGLSQKSFIDCGGQLRQSAACVLQLWTATDLQHRMTAGKLLKILDLAEPMFGFNDLPVEVEYGENVKGLYSLESGNLIKGNPLAMIPFDLLSFNLVAKQTDCLAKDKCGIETCEGSCQCLTTLTAQSP